MVLLWRSLRLIRLADMDDDVMRFWRLGIGSDVMRFLMMFWDRWEWMMVFWMGARLCWDWISLGRCDALGNVEMRVWISFGLRLMIEFLMVWIEVVRELRDVERLMNSFESKRWSLMIWVVIRSEEIFVRDVLRREMVSSFVRALVRLSEDCWALVAEEMADWSWVILIWMSAWESLSALRLEVSVWILGFVCGGLIELGCVDDG